MNAISSYRGNRHRPYVRHKHRPPHTHGQDRLQCTTPLSSECSVTMEEFVSSVSGQTWRLRQIFHNFSARRKFLSAIGSLYACYKLVRVRPTAKGYGPAVHHAHINYQFLLITRLGTVPSNAGTVSKRMEISSHVLPAQRIARSLLRQRVCLSVCLSVAAGIVSKRLNLC